jgi:small-conductance mechanosensitive channel
MQRLTRSISFTCLALALQLTGCSIKATIDQTTDTTTNVTGTTSSARSWVTEDGQLKPDFKATAFATVSQANLRQDLAAGRGEYLASMSVLLGVPSDLQPTFFSAAQARYAGTTDSTGSDLLALLREAAAPFIP